MKKVIVLAVVALMSTSAFATDARKPAAAAKPAVKETSMSTGTTAPDKTYNIRVNALSLAFGTISLAGEYGVSDGVTVGPEVFYNTSSLGTSSSSNIGLGLKSVIYFNGRRLSDGFYVSPFADVLLSSYTDTSSGTASLTSFVAGANVGYQWMWQSGFNLNLGVGAQYVSIGDSITYTASNGTKTTGTSYGLHGVVPSVELALGYAF